MAKYSLIVSDPPYSFSDSLTMSDVKRSSQSNYDTLTIEDIKNLDIPSITEDNAILVLWVPSALLQDGLDIMKAYGFVQKQTWIWVKTKDKALSVLIKDLYKKFQDLDTILENAEVLDNIKKFINEFDINNILNFNMGRIFRQTHELALIGTKGKITGLLQSKSQRSVFLGPNYKHSQKPEALQDKLDIMYPSLKKLEIFARRERDGWTCIGNEINNAFCGEDIRDSIKRLAAA